MRPAERGVRPARGFTLLEVLVATAVFAIAALSLLNAQNTQVRTDQYLDVKTIAHWVALNHLADLRLKKVFPELDESRVTARMGGREWLVITKAQATPTPNVRLLTVSVAENPEDFNDEVTPVTSVTGFIARASNATP